MNVFLPALPKEIVELLSSIFVTNDTTLPPPPGELIKTEPTVLAAGDESNVNQSIGPEASAYGSRRETFASTVPEVKVTRQRRRSALMLIISLITLPVLAHDQIPGLRNLAPSSSRARPYT